MFSRDLFDSNSVSDVLGWRVTLVRLEPGVPITVRFYPSIIQSLRFHYIARALPCSGEDCPACYAGVGSRQVFYLACADNKDPRHYGLVEISDSTMSSLLEAAAGFDASTKWLTAKLSRRARNKPIMVEELRRAEVQGGSFTPKLIMSMLARLYELPMPESDQADTWRHQCRFIMEQRLTRAVKTL